MWKPVLVIVACGMIGSACSKYDPDVVCKKLGQRIKADLKLLEMHSNKLSAAVQECFSGAVEVAKDKRSCAKDCMSRPTFETTMQCWVSKCQQAKAAARVREAFQASKLK